MISGTISKKGWKTPETGQKKTETFSGKKWNLLRSGWSPVKAVRENYHASTGPTGQYPRWWWISLDIPLDELWVSGPGFRPRRKFRDIYFGEYFNYSWFCVFLELLPIMDIFLFLTIHPWKESWITWGQAAVDEAGAGNSKSIRWISSFLSSWAGGRGRSPIFINRWISALFL